MQYSGSLTPHDLMATYMRPACPVIIYRGKIKLDKSPLPMQQHISLE